MGYKKQNLNSDLENAKERGCHSTSEKTPFCDNLGYLLPFLHYVFSPSCEICRVPRPQVDEIWQLWKVETAEEALPIEEDGVGSFYARNVARIVAQSAGGWEDSRGSSSGYFK